MSITAVVLGGTKISGGGGAGAIVVERLVLHQSGFGGALDHAGRTDPSRRYPFQPRAARAPPRCVLSAL